MRIFPDTINCERCLSGEEATYVVSSDVIHMTVCASCAEEARKLGLTLISRRELGASSTAMPVAQEELGFQMKLVKLLGATAACLAVGFIYLRVLRNRENMKVSDFFHVLKR